LAAFDNRLTGEIVGTYDFATGISSTANATGRSKRRGIEVAAEFRPVGGLRVSANYTFLKAQDQQVSNGLRLREVRRPKHSGSLALDYEGGPVTIGASLAYVGERSDVDNDLFPAPRVILDDYVLASLRLAYRLTEAIELFARVDNLGGADYQDLVGYETPGRTVHAGLRLRVGS
jgi:vitamin B12 transporter